MKFFILLLFLLLLFPIAYAQPTITSWDLTRTLVYEDEIVIFSVRAYSNTSISSVKIGLTNYTIEMEKRMEKIISLNLESGNATDGRWFYFFQEKEGVYIITNITAIDATNSTTIDEDTFSIISFKVRKSGVTPTINCSTNFTLNKTTFNSTESVNYTIKMENLGNTLTNLNFSIESPIETTLKELSSTSLLNNQTLDLEFEFTAPNVSEDTNYSFSLNVTSDECNFTFPFQFEIKKFVGDIREIAWESITEANSTIQVSKSQNRNTTTAEGLLDQAIEEYGQENYQSAKELANQAKYEAQIAQEIKGGFEITAWLIAIIVIVVILIVIIVKTIFFIKNLLKEENNKNSRLMYEV